MNKKLNILIANWTWFGIGGDWTYIDNLRRLYEEHGHAVVPFSMQSDRNVDAGGYERYFVKSIDYKELNRNKTPVNIVRAGTRTIYSIQAKQNLERLLDEHEIHVAHLHNIHHYITPSILPVLKKRRIPVIWTLHDYTLICPENCFVSGNRICEKCRGGRFYHCALQRCKKDSFLASSLAALENYVHRCTHVFKYVDLFLCPSAFLLNKFRSFHFHPEKLVLTRLCFPFERGPVARKPGNYILFVGRLDKIKGIITLLKAMDGLNIELRIAGTGEQYAELAQFAAARNMQNIVFLGHMSKPGLYELHMGARLAVCPSECYENFPFSVIESMCFRTPVVASAIGGIPELVVHEETGLLFRPFDFLDLRQQIMRLYNDPVLQTQLAGQAYERTASMVSYQQHYHVLRGVYERLGLAL